MDVIIWISKSLFKFMIIVLISEIVEIKSHNVNDAIILVGFILSVFSSVPFKKQH